MAVSIQHTSNTPLIGETDWEGPGAHEFTGLSNNTLVGKVAGVVQPITIGANGGFNGTVLDFSGTQGPAGPVGLPMVFTSAVLAVPGAVEVNTGQIAINSLNRESAVIDRLWTALSIGSILVVQGDAGNDHNVTVKTTTGFGQIGGVSDPTFSACITIIGGSKDSFNVSELLTVYTLPGTYLSDTPTSLVGFVTGNGNSTSNCSLRGTDGQIDVSNGTPTAGQTPTLSLSNPLVVPGIMNASNITTLDTQVNVAFSNISLLQSNVTTLDTQMAGALSNITTLQDAVLALQVVLGDRATATIDATTIAASTFNFGTNGTLVSVT